MSLRSAGLVPMRLPPLDPGIQWYALAVSVGVYPDTHFDIFYFIPRTTAPSTVTTGHLYRDFAASNRALWYFDFMPSGVACNAGPHYFWDGTTLHSYPNQGMVTGTYSSAITAKVSGVSFSLRTTTMPLRGVNGFFGRKFFSPIPTAWFTGNRWNSTGVSQLQAMGNTFWGTPFNSQAIRWDPAILSDKLTQLKLVNQWWFNSGPTVLRRRNREGPWTARLIFPPAFPLPDG